MGGLSAMATARAALAQAPTDWPSLLARLEGMRAALLVADGAIINLSAVRLRLRLRLRFRVRLRLRLRLRLRRRLRLGLSYPYP